MPWASTTEYNDAIQNLRTSVSDEELRAGELARTPQGTPLEGIPLLWSGNFADVYKVHCPATGNTWAVKCFTRESRGLRERYREISAHLKQARLPFMVDFHFVEPGIRAGGGWHPFLKMHWVEGLALNEFVEQYLERPATLRQLLQLWVKLAARLREARIAHADLQHGNVLLVPMPQGQLALRLIDYDGMYVPALAKRTPGEVGHPAYQHPQRLREGIYDPEVDRFSHLAIYSAVRCLTVGKGELWTRFNNDDNLLFREVDFRSPGNSEVFHRLWSLRDEDARALVGHLILATQTPLDRVPLLNEVVSDGKVRPLSHDEEEQVKALMDGGASQVRAVARFTPEDLDSWLKPLPSEKKPAEPLAHAEVASSWGIVSMPSRSTTSAPGEPQPTSSARGRTRGTVANGGIRPALSAALERGKGLLDAAAKRSGLRLGELLAIGIVTGIVVTLAVSLLLPVPTRPVREEVTIDLDNGVTMDLVLIPAGEFLMGSPDSDGDAGGGEKPQHQVRITQPFYLGKYEVTQEQWQAVMGANPSRFKGPKNPVEQVSWDDCQEFLRRVNQKHGSREVRFVLPTEAEWEYACRAGSTTRWCFGDDEATLEDYAWYDVHGAASTHPVGQKRPNAWRLYDVHGNVWEWCADWYDRNYYGTSPSNDPKGPDSAHTRVFRGGSRYNDASGTRSAIRSGGTPDDRHQFLGFRVAGTP